MSGYDWEMIVSNYSDEELKRIHREHFKEPQVKVDAVAQEMYNRGLLKDASKKKPSNSKELRILEIEEIKNRTKPNKIQAFIAIASFGFLFFISSLSLISDYKILSYVFQYHEPPDTLADSADNLTLVLLILSFAIAATCSYSWYTRLSENTNLRIKNFRYFLEKESKDLSSVRGKSPFIFNQLFEKTDMVLKHRKIPYIKSIQYQVFIMWETLIIFSVIAIYLYVNIIDGIDYFTFIMIQSCISLFKVSCSILAIFSSLVIIDLITKEDLLYRSEQI